MARSLLKYKTEEAHNQYPIEPIEHIEPSLTLASPLGNSDRGYQGTYTEEGDTREAGIPISLSPSIGEAYALSGGRQGAKPPVPSGYKEPYAKVATSRCSRIIKGQCLGCPTNVVKVIYCGKEWCSECGQDWSVVHQRRFARLLPKARQLSGFGYFVIEFPDRYRKLRGWVYSKVGLRRASNLIVSVLAGERKGRRGRVGGFFSRGFMRWHWFGDRNTGKYNPHANVIVEAGYLPEEKLNEIKAKLSRALLCPDLIVHYSYRKSEGEMVHSLKYITRATFHDKEWNGYMASEIYGFRNIRYWGNWKGENAWGSEGDNVYSDIEKLERNCCPDCGSKIKWQGKAMSIHYLDMWQSMGITSPLGGGYFKVNFPGIPRGLPGKAREAEDG